jgi:uncharacterized protein
MNLLNQSDDPPVTVDVLQQVKPGCEDEFERVLSDLLLAAESFEGHLGVNIFRPTDRHHPEYRIIFKFDHMSNLTSWENSPIRHRLLEHTKRLTVGSNYQRLTGLEGVRNMVYLAKSRCDRSASSLQNGDRHLAGDFAID